MALKPCLRCGELSHGSYCPRHNRPGSTRRWRQTRREVFRFFGQRCVYCGEPAEHVDHLIPVTDGGTDQISNLRPACARCNLEKGAS